MSAFLESEGINGTVTGLTTWLFVSLWGNSLGQDPVRISEMQKRKMSNGKGIPSWEVAREE